LFDWVVVGDKDTADDEKSKGVSSSSSYIAVFCRSLFPFCSCGPTITSFLTSQEKLPLSSSAVVAAAAATAGDTGHRKVACQSVGCCGSSHQSSCRFLFLGVDFGLSSSSSSSLLNNSLFVVSSIVLHDILFFMSRICLDMRKQR